MRNPIPDDWTGKWACYSINWPDSVLWIALLHGALADLHAGRRWDERSGSILAVQAITQEIWDRNYPLIPCVVCEEPECPAQENCGGGVVVEETEMGQVVTDVTIENGVLTVWFGPCCPKPLTGFTVEQTAPPDLGDDPLVPEGQTPPTYLPCGKATAAINEIWKVGNDAWDDAFGSLPWEWLYSMGSIAPELHGGLNNWVDAHSLAILINAVFTKAYVFQDDNKQQLICELAARLEADDLGTTDDDFDWIKNKIHDQWNTAETLIDQFWMAIMDCIGSGDLRNISRLGATTTAECGCPELITIPNPPSGLDWYYEFDFRDYPLHASIDLVWDTISYHEPGVGIWAYCGPTNNDNHVYLTVEFDQVNNGSILTYIHLVLKAPNLPNILNTGNGNFVKVGSTSHLALADYLATMGDPQPPGTYAFTRQFSDALGADNSRLEVDVNGYHVTGQQEDDIPANSFLIVSLAMGGTGPGPLSDPPV